MSVTTGVPARRNRVLRRVTVVSTVAAVAAGMLATAAVAAPGGNHPRGHLTPAAQPAPQPVTGGNVHYAVSKSVCSQRVRPGYSNCFAMRRVTVPKGTPGARPFAVSNGLHGPAGGFTPATIASAYRVNPNGGKGQTVAIVDAYDDPYAATELARFDRHYGLHAETSKSFVKVNQNGSRDKSKLPPADAGWSGEIALDLQAVRGLCHKCRILLVEANNPSNANLAKAVNTAAKLGADEISNSYGGPEKYSTNTIAAAYKHHGVVITASTGDHGWYDWDFANDIDQSNPANSGASDNRPNTPAAYPTVVAVGGTGLTVHLDASRKQEYVWNENGVDDQVGLEFGDQGASGGGCSRKFAAPGWERTVANYGNTSCGKRRMTGDVAALADPATGYDIYSHYNGGWNTFGGTSLASPLTAAIFALAGGSGGQAYPSRSLYTNYKYHRGSAYDVTLGGNAFCAGDDKTSCSNALKNDVGDPTFDGNPNNLANGTNQYPNGWAGLLDCGYAYDGGTGLRSHDSQCNAYPGFDGPSGIGTPNGINMFRHSNPGVKLLLPNTIRAKTRVHLRCSVSEPISQAHITGYQWNFGDGRGSTRKDPYHTFAHVKTYLVTLTVTDSIGQKTVKKVKVNVQHRS